MNSGWQTACLGDVLAVLKNGLNCKQDKSGLGQRISRIESISLASFDLARVGYAEISDQDRGKFKLSKGDILFSHINSPIHVGKTAVFDIDDEVYHGVNLLLMRPTPAVSATYLELYLKYLFGKGYWLSVCKQSVNQASVNQKDISRVPIAYPVDLAEQRRIVADLDEALEGIATAKANAEKNLQNAREIFESHLAGVFSARNAGWTDRPLHSLCQRITVGHVGSMANLYKPAGIPFLRSQNIRPFSVSMQNMVYIDKQFHAALQKSSLQAGDVAIVRTGYPGTAAVVPDSLGVANCSDLVIVRPGPEIDAHFLTAFFNSSFGKNMVSGKVVGAAQKHFNVGAAKEVVLHLPPLHEQQAINVAADEIREESDRLQNIFERKLAALDDLRKSLLHQAFTGALTAKTIDEQVAEVA